MTTTTTAAPASTPTAAKLLPRKRRAQIETWLDETIRHASLQTCACHQTDDDHTLSTCQTCNRPTTSPPNKSSISFSLLLGGLKKTALRLGGGSSSTIEEVDKKKKKTSDRALLGEEGFDPALSTKMFSVPDDDDDDKAGEKHKNSRGGGGGSSSNVDPASSDDDDDDDAAGKRELQRRMARLKRAQKLLAKQQGPG